ncbi:MAG: hypothetical protein ACI81W_000032, partial [Saprospiraceae bacterium]
SLHSLLKNSINSREYLKRNTCKKEAKPGEVKWNWLGKEKFIDTVGKQGKIGIFFNQHKIRK